MKKATKIITSVILSLLTLVLCFCVGVNLKNKHQIEKHAEEREQSGYSEQNTDSFATTAVQKLVELPVQTDEQKLQTVANAINALKSGQIAFRGEADEIFDISLSDCSVPLLAGAVLKSAHEYVSGDQDYSSGTSSRISEATQADALDRLPPYGKQCEFLPEGVKEVTSEVKGYWIYYRIKLASECTSYPDLPPTHTAALGQLDFSDNPNIMWIDNIRYGETEIEAVINTADNNHLISYNVTVPMQISNISGKVMGIYGTADINVDTSYYWNFTY